MYNKYELYYINEEYMDDYELIGKYKSQEECFKEITDFWKKLGYKIPYFNISYPDGYRKIDIGFHNKFYRIYPPLQTNDFVIAYNCPIYKDSYGGGKKEQYFKNNPIYQVLDTFNEYAMVRHFSLNHGITGFFKISDLERIGTIVDKREKSDEND